jgi:hypothetical protein
MSTQYSTTYLTITFSDGIWAFSKAERRLREVIIKILLTVSVLSPLGFVVGTLPELVDRRKEELELSEMV